MPDEMADRCDCLFNKLADAKADIEALRSIFTDIAYRSYDVMQGAIRLGELAREHEAYVREQLGRANRIFAIWGGNDATRDMLRATEADSLKDGSRRP